MALSKEVELKQFPKVFADLAYASDSPEQKLDIFLPEDGEGPYPLVVLVHGGGWIAGGRREECVSCVFKIISQGYALATVDYRLAPGSIWPAQIYDVKTAIRFLRAHRDEYHINTDKIVVWCNSAGAHISNVLAATGGRDILENKRMGYPQESSAIQGLISWYGVFDLPSQDADMTETSGQECHANGSSMKCPPCMEVGYIIEGNPRSAEAASCSPYMTPDYPPTLIQHGKKDCIVSWKQSQKFYDKITELCGEGRAILEYMDEANHGDPLFKTDENTDRCLDFLDSIYFPEGDRPSPRTPLPAIHCVEVTEKSGPQE